MKVFIITEGSRDIGFGHITRCTSLYQAFEEKGVLPIFLIHGDETLKDLLNNKNHDIFNWTIEEEKLLTFIEYADVVIIDSYLADYELYKKVSNLVKVPVYIDDNKRIDYPRGIVVNGTVYADELNYPEKQDVTYLLGSQYTPIRKKFWDVTDKEIKENVKTIMVTFGGDDARNMTPSILTLAKENFPALTKKVIIGKGFKNTEQIESLKDEKTELIYYPDAEGMKKAMLESDVAISASGQTLYELARVGVPTIAISVAENQMNNVKGWQKTGFIEYAGWWENEHVFSNVIQKLELLQNAVLRQEKAKRGKTSVDGLGAIRIIRYCLKIYIDNSLVLRKAAIKDMYNIYELSNNPDVRKNSFSPDRIELEHHKIWFDNTLNNETCFFLIAEIDNIFAGQVRFDINGVEATISISISKQYRGIGVGKLTIQKALHMLYTEHPNIQYVKSYIKKGNVYSMRLFEKAGFQYIMETLIKGQDALEYRYQFNKG